MNHFQLRMGQRICLGDLSQKKTSEILPCAHIEQLSKTGQIDISYYLQLKQIFSLKQRGSQKEL